jgi:hypothetical protein
VQALGAPINAKMAALSTELDEAFEAARAEFIGSLNRRNLPAAQALSKATSIHDVVDAIAEVEAQQQRSGRLRALGRLAPFVRGLQEYAGVVEVFIQAKQDVLSLIWVSGLTCDEERNLEICDADTSPLSFDEGPAQVHSRGMCVMNMRHCYWCFQIF